jgi:hypothetical protein
MVVPLTKACVLAAAVAFGHPPEALWSLLSVEHGQVGQAHLNANGSSDYGPFQVNDVHVPGLAKLLGVSKNDTAVALRDDGCFNAYAAAYLLRLRVDDAGGDLWLAMGNYHSRTPAVRGAYQQRLQEALRAFPSR